MGRDKASIEVDGRPAVELMKARLVDAGCSNARAVAPRGMVPMWDLHADVHDLGEGPLGGVRAALTDCDTEWALVVAVDHLGFTPDAMRRLIDESLHSPGRPELVLARADLAGSPPQHLLSMWRMPDMLRRVDRAWDAGTRAIRAVVEDSRVHHVDFDARLVRNINSPDDLRAFADSR